MDTYHTYRLKDIGKFSITDEKTGAVYTGGDQEWYGRLWQRLSGCGPTAASNIFQYFGKIDTLEEYRVLMNDVWKYVTPTRHGVYCTKIFYEGCVKFAESKGLAAAYRYLDIPDISGNASESAAVRPVLSEVISFIKESLEADIPVAFLSLDPGSEKVIDRWHWITVIAMYGTADDMRIDFLDAGKIKHASLSGWYRTTKEGGGFVSVSVSSRASS